MFELPINHQNALLLCVRYVNRACIKDLLKKYKLDFSITDLHGNSILHLIMMREFGEEDKIKTLKLFYDGGHWQGMSLNAENDSRKTVLDLVNPQEIELESYIMQMDGKRSEPKVIKAPILLKYLDYSSSPASPMAPMEIADTCSREGTMKRRFPL